MLGLVGWTASACPAPFTGFCAAAGSVFDCPLMIGAGPWATQVAPATVCRASVISTTASSGSPSDAAGSLQPSTRSDTTASVVPPRQNPRPFPLGEPIMVPLPLGVNE